MGSGNIQLIGHSILRAWKRGVLEECLFREGVLGVAQARARFNGALLFTSHKKNLITSVGLSLAPSVLVGDDTPILAFHAIGTNSTAPSLGDTILNTEVARKAISSSALIANGPQLFASVFYLASESTFNILEEGLFGGATATSTANTGKLFSRYLQTYDNSSGNVDLTFDYDLTFKEGT